MLETTLFRETAICTGMVECPILTVYFHPDPQLAFVKMDSAIVLKVKHNDLEYAKLLHPGYEQNLARIDYLFGQDAYDFQIPLQFLEKQLEDIRRYTDLAEDTENQILTILKEARISYIPSKCTFQYRLAQIKRGDTVDYGLARIDRETNRPEDWYLLRHPKIKSKKFISTASPDDFDNDVCLPKFHYPQHAPHEWSIWRKPTYFFGNITNLTITSDTIMESGCAIMLLEGEPNPHVPQKYHKIAFADPQTGELLPSDDEPQPFVVYEEFYGNWQTCIKRSSRLNYCYNPLCDHFTMLHTPYGFDFCYHELDPKTYLF